MRTQTNIFNDPIEPSHHADDLTHEAWMARNVLEALQRRGKEGGTAVELAHDMNLQPGQVGPALGELRMWKKVRKTEAKRGNKAVYLAL